MRFWYFLSTRFSSLYKKRSDLIPNHLHRVYMQPPPLPRNVKSVNICLLFMMCAYFSHPPAYNAHYSTKARTHSPTFEGKQSLPSRHTAPAAIRRRNEIPPAPKGLHLNRGDSGTPAKPATCTGTLKRALRTPIIRCKTQSSANEAQTLQSEATHDNFDTGPDTTERHA